MERWINRIIELEGVHLMPHRHILGKTYIGVRRCLEDFPLTTEERKALGDYMHGITNNGAKMLLRNDLYRCYESLKRHIKRFENTDEERQFAVLYFYWYYEKKGIRQNYALFKYVERGNFAMATYEFLQTTFAQRRPKCAQKIATALKKGVWKLI